MTYEPSPEAVEVLSAAMYTPDDSAEEILARLVDTDGADVLACELRPCDLGRGHVGRCWWESGTDDD